MSLGLEPVSQDGSRVRVTDSNGSSHEIDIEMMALGLEMARQLPDDILPDPTSPFPALRPCARCGRSWAHQTHRAQECVFMASLRAEPQEP